MFSLYWTISTLSVSYLLHHLYDIVSLICTTAEQRLSPALILFSIYCTYGPVLRVVQFIPLSHFRSARELELVGTRWLPWLTTRPARANMASLVPLCHKSHSSYIRVFSYICIAFYCQQNTFTFCNLCTRHYTK